MKTVNMTVVKMVVSKDKHLVYWKAVLMVSKRDASMVSYSADSMALQSVSQMVAMMEMKLVDMKVWMKVVWMVDLTA